MKSLRLAIPILALSMTGCLTHVPAKEDSCSLQIGWRESYEDGRRAAAESRRPMLLVMVAGALQDHC